VINSGDLLQRKILMLAVTGDLLWRLPSGAMEFLFFADQPSTGPKPPRAHLGRVLDDFRSKAGRGEHPGREGMDEQVTAYTATLPEAIKQMVEDEWRVCRQSVREIPDAMWVAGQALQWYRHRKLAEAMLRSSQHIGPDPFNRDAYHEATETLIRAIRETADFGQNLPEPVIGTRDRSWYLREDTELGIRTGLKWVDNIVHTGVKPGEIFYLLAPPKGNKTLLLMQIALNAVRARKHGVWFSYEMRSKAMMLRADRNLAHATREELREDVWTTRPLHLNVDHLVLEPMPDAPEQTHSLAHVLRTHRQAGVGELWLQECATQRDAVSEGERVIDELRAQGHPIDFAVFDYLNLMSSETREKDKRFQLTRISRDMASLAKRAEIAVWSAALVNRKSISKDRVRKDDIAESFEVIAVVDGAIAICAPPRMLARKHWLLYLAALRDAEDQNDAGIYLIDRDRMTVHTTPHATLEQYAAGFEQHLGVERPEGEHESGES
jgi:hypothetical protein